MADVAGSPAPPTPPALPPQKPTWSEPVFRAGLYVGIGLLVVGLLAQTFLLAPYIVALLVICSGLGIIFGAFGSLAVLQYKGLVIAGVATIAIALLVLVNQLSDSLLRIRLDGDVKGASIVLSGDETYPAADRKTSVEFFVLAQTIDVERLALLVTLPSEKAADGTLTPGAEINFECIPAASIRPFLGSGRPLQWRFDAKRRVLTGLSGVDKGIVLDGPCREEGEPVTASIGASSFSPVSSAFAQGQSVESLLADLNSDSTVVRRDARLALSALGPTAVRPMMDYWAKNSDDYRIQLGVSVALTEYLRDHKDQRRDVSALLTDTDFTLIARAIGDPDRTLRAYVTEFLRDLADPRIIAAARNSFVAASPQGKFNYVFAINGVIDDLSAQQKVDIRTLLDAWRKMVGTQTQAEIDKVLARL